MLSLVFKIVEDGARAGCLFDTIILVCVHLSVATDKRKGVMHRTEVISLSSSLLAELFSNPRSDSGVKASTVCQVVMMDFTVGTHFVRIKKEG